MENEYDNQLEDLNMNTSSVNQTMMRKKKVKKFKKKKKVNKNNQTVAVDYTIN